MFWFDFDKIIIVAQPFSNCDGNFISQPIKNKRYTCLAGLFSANREFKSCLIRYNDDRQLNTLPNCRCY